MQKLGLNELREKFLRFFESKGHLRLPSFSLIPRNDPSILMINAGMTPLKPYFTGRETPPSKRIVTCQKCVRTPDIENVGKTSRHGTFFEMLGNFSFGDYFKKEAIPWAWEFFTEVLNMPEEKLSVSVYEEDDEAYEIWNKVVGLPHEKIVRLGKEDNFWEHGTGPCGPCSEIYYDMGKDKGCGKPGCVAGCDCDRFIEVWNLVFTQFDKQEDGSYLPLENKNIDTGMGLERLACVIQGVDNIFEVDTLRSILDHVCTVAGVEYGRDYDKDVSIRVVTDHIRSAGMMISDGILPSNEGRGYVLRRLVRRAARHGKLLGINEKFLAGITDTMIDESKLAYPHMDEKRDYIKKVIDIEEEKFYSTIDQGMDILNSFMDEVKSKGEDILSGYMVFKLHDTYGFPLELTREIASENGLSIDEAGFEKEMMSQKEMARQAQRAKEGSAWEKGASFGIDGDFKTGFTGYTGSECNGRIMCILKDGAIVTEVKEGDKAVIITDKTPFYAESGGQVGDTGYIESDEGLFKIGDCKKTDDKYLHFGTVERGIIEKDSAVKVKIDKKRRNAIAKNHTATHLLHKALKNVLGTHVNQAGSLVTPDRLRFDFTHFKPLTLDELKRVEDEVNEKIMEDIPVHVKEMSIEEAEKIGATALFGEKYGSIVRVVSINGYSTELCGGTHLTSTSQAGLIKILGEGGIAAGVRRIEALTGEAAIEYFNEKERTLDKIAMILKTSPEEVLKKSEALVAELQECKKEIEQLENKLINASLGDVLSSTVQIGGINVVMARFERLDIEALRNTGDVLKNKLGSGVVALAAVNDEKVNFVVTATKDVVKKGIHSGNIIKEIAKIAGGGGGGRPDMAQAGGKDAAKVDEALKHVFAAVKAQLEILDKQ